jgi:hypothetical protein
MESGDILQYVFRVNLKRSRGVWRTVSLRDDHTLHDLHEMIFKAFDRYDDEHMYSFYFPRAQSRRDAGSTPPREYTSPVVFEEPGSYRDEGVLDASEAELGSLNMQVGETFEYLFDFGDSWWHQGKLISVDHIDSPTGGKLPTILERHGQSPEQYPQHDE